MIFLNFLYIFHKHCIFGYILKKITNYYFIGKFYFKASNIKIQQCHKIVTIEIHSKNVFPWKKNCATFGPF